MRHHSTGIPVTHMQCVGVWQGLQLVMTSGRVFLCRKTTQSVWRGAKRGWVGESHIWVLVPLGERKRQKANKLPHFKCETQEALYLLISLTFFPNQYMYSYKSCSVTCIPSVQSFKSSLLLSLGTCHGEPVKSFDVHRP